jgi:hypothetical protein
VSQKYLKTEGFDLILELLGEMPVFGRVAEEKPDRLYGM